VNRKDIAQRCSAHRRSDAGDTLVEVLITIIILSVTGLALLEGFTTTLTGSAQYQSLAGNDVVLRAAAESAFSMIEQQAVPAYSPCAVPKTYNDLAGTPPYGAPSGYTATITAVGYWNGTDFTGPQPACNASPAPQLITMVVTKASNSTTEQTQFVVNNLNASANVSAVTVAALSPSSIPQNGSAVPVVITGSGFSTSDNDVVTFSSGDIQATSWVVESPTTIAATVSLDPLTPVGYYGITVTDTTLGISGQADNLLHVTSAPTVINVSPGSLAQGGSRTFTLGGTQFTSGMSVVLYTASGGDPGVTVGSINVTSSTTATFLATANSSASIGDDSITVTLPGGGSDTSAPIFAVTAPPMITSPTSSSPCNPGFAGTANCTITGSNFEQGAVVTISPSSVGGVNSYSVNSTGTQILVNVSGANSGTSGATGNFVVTNPDGTVATAVGGFVNGP